MDWGGRVGAVHGGVVRDGQERVRGVHLHPAVPHPLPRLGWDCGHHGLVKFLNFDINTKIPMSNLRRNSTLVVGAVAAWNNGKSGALWCGAEFSKMSSSTTWWCSRQTTVVLSSKWVIQFWEILAFFPTDFSTYCKMCSMLLLLSTVQQLPSTELCLCIVWLSDGPAPRRWSSV